MTSTAQRLCPTAVAAGVRDLVAGLEAAPMTVAVASYSEFRGIINAAEARRLSFAMAAAEEAGQDPLKAARSAASLGGKTSRRDADSAAKRARAIRANEELGVRLDSGELSTGQIDNIARAMDTDEAAATDTVLIEQIAERSVDQGRRAANDWATEKTSAKDLEAKHSKQRRARKVTTYWSGDNDAFALTLYGDGPSIETLWQAINAQERVEYRNDGGRDVRLQDHPRTRDQRRFDAAMAILTGTAKPAGGRPAAVISVPWSKISGNNPDSCMEQIGHGPIPDSIALKALMESDLFMNITGLHGQTLWFGRTRRHADRNQFISLALRRQRLRALRQRLANHRITPPHALRSTRQRQNQPRQPRTRVFRLSSPTPRQPPHPPPKPGERRMVNPASHTRRNRTQTTHHKTHRQTPRHQTKTTEQPEPTPIGPSNDPLNYTLIARPKTDRALPRCAHPKPQLPHQPLDNYIEGLAGSKPSMSSSRPSCHRVNGAAGSQPFAKLGCETAAPVAI